MTHRGIHIDGRAVAAPNPGPAPMLQWLAIDRLVTDAGEPTEALRHLIARAEAEVMA